MTVVEAGVLSKNEKLMLSWTCVLAHAKTVHHKAHARVRLGWAVRAIQMRRIVCYHFSHLSAMFHSASITTCDITSAAARLKASATASATCFPNLFGHWIISSSCTMESNFAMNCDKMCHR